VGLLRAQCLCCVAHARRAANAPERSQPPNSSSQPPATTAAALLRGVKARALLPPLPCVHASEHTHVQQASGLPASACGGVHLQRSPKRRHASPLSPVATYMQPSGLWGCARHAAACGVHPASAPGERTRHSTAVGRMAATPSSRHCCHHTAKERSPPRVPHPPCHSDVRTPWGRPGVACRAGNAAALQLERVAALHWARRACCPDLWPEKLLKHAPRKPMGAVA
jgi:hypothetical protein